MLGFVFAHPDAGEDEEQLQLPYGRMLSSRHCFCFIPFAGVSSSLWVLVNGSEAVYAVAFVLLFFVFVSCCFTFLRCFAVVVCCLSLVYILISSDLSISASALDPSIFRIVFVIVCIFLLFVPFSMGCLLKC